MRILVTGGAGYIGSHTVKALIDKGHKPIVIDNLVYGHKYVVTDILKVPLIVGQVGNKKQLMKILLGEHEDLKGTVHEGKTIEAVMHFAAYAYVAESMENPLKYYLNNVVQSTILLDAICDYKVVKKTFNNLPIPIIFSSTCATYGIPKEFPITEKTKQKPINPYGKSKLFIEEMIKDLGRYSNLKSVILRYFNAAGAMPDSSLGEMHKPETHLIPLVIQSALGMRDNIEVFGNDYETKDGTCIRDYIHVCDLADAHVSALSIFSNESKSNYLKNKDNCLVFNLGNGYEVSVQDIINIVQKISNKKIKVIFSPRRLGDAPKLIASSIKIEKILGWKPKFNKIEKIVEDSYNWQKKNIKRYLNF
ncbi:MULTISPECIES: UDP-glucose 4-epimerase GalE [Prochlorococcus]|uniref:UDP-glucose 4-epimerase n=1 Tax=Prochlorococcus marinus str. MIT 9116 TaxID=167544 RepID=A0A0A1ZY81_PROMR|nr:UDP-glucose 4-epimerase GalE [Prochlorococcus marinus]KGF91706.1 UDP-glucose 4-epimerase [Prochlorococcus marinus str. MIT 9107]KGF93108.1 UDP-glucose 4-epimerase [Prochlorococcus marinus str. MIT 9116]KGF95071.1 UDP-glucose 4-epimerase [Prochlorococcus marinus str. MIT 9123]